MDCSLMHDCLVLLNSKLNLHYVLFCLREIEENQYSTYRVGKGKLTINLK